MAAKKTTTKKTTARNPSAPKTRGRTTGIKIAAAKPAPKLTPEARALEVVRLCERHRSNCEAAITTAQMELSEAKAAYHASDTAVMVAKEKYQRARAARIASS